MKVHNIRFADGKWSEDIPKNLDDENTLVLIFGNSKEATKQLISCFPQSQLIGCSSAGEIYGNHVYVNTLQASIISFEKCKIRSVCHEFGDYENSLKAGETIMDKLNEDSSLNAVLVLGDGFMNGDQFSKGLHANNTHKAKIAGGLAGDPEIKDTWVIAKDGIKRNSAVAVGFYGSDLDFIVSSVAGCTPLGVERTVTKSEKNTLYEVNSKPVTEFYTEFLGDKIDQFKQLPIQFPVAISKDYKIEDGGLIRTPFGINNEENSITFTGEIPEGSSIRLMIAGQDSLIEGSEEAAEMVHNAHQKIPQNEYLLLPISCLTRKLVLGELVEDEVEVICDQFNNGKYAINGFYSFGEISTDERGLCSLHNQTMNLVLIYEK